MAEQQLERSMLDGKDREQLHAIAGAMGIKGVTRLRKADLVDAILEAASGNGAAANGASNGAANGAKKATKATKATKTAAKAVPASDAAADAEAEAPPPARRSVRSKRASELESDGDLAALAAEEDALAGGDEPEVVPRPMRRDTSTRSDTPSTTAKGADAGSTDTPGGATEAREGGGSKPDAKPAPNVDPEDERASFGEGNRTGRRRRRRGRERNQGGGGGGGQGNNERDRIP